MATAGRQFRSHGQQPSEAEVTLGASKQREHQTHSADLDTRLDVKDRGKRTRR